MTGIHVSLLLKLIIGIMTLHHNNGSLDYTVLFLFFYFTVHAYAWTKELRPLRTIA